MRRVNIADPEFNWDEGDPEGFRAALFGPAPTWARPRPA